MKASWLASSMGLLLAAVTIATPIPLGPAPSASEAGFDANAESWTKSNPEAPAIFPALEPAEVTVALPEGQGAEALPLTWNPLVRHATEPSALVLLGTGLLGIATLLRRRQRPSK